ncbi:uncharacterized protein PHALS_15230 [Plasmopara halstedii]|uniref:Uncharacterized protein n=1 Tax=Plasmopara halstedii TaxID=4781 RepID=A0A0P1ASQ5_PLAHL|nr:uncharacterized protein PHALS_15230 [Plasmopara halstedii]CEG44444.1 hypothetical protein PHALS_15230 [Plasmopara halstedii]|eukprot:XP_024580813.1 hypothetical protein PHALS_15230 [Plasmopara halstedii]
MQCSSNCVLSDLQTESYSHFQRFSAVGDCDVNRLRPEAQNYRQPWYFQGRIAQSHCYFLLDHWSFFRDQSPKSR